ncbi:hypothetical protein PR202_ga14317 [Eleusine coracana subsp. coracana]|uniref:NAC domain-containing protein n=1 Tax=Eleusine coracana subsp. coracana TaxID=191504 RepID=A0AAV5CH57_ELECO|nr:hypothetical protein PR202_ga14317 [Eleusine coracana subsp. coracana]
MDARGGTSTAELELPGFRFHPTEEELLEFYLKQVAHGKKLKFDIIPTVQLYRHEPWELPGMARIGEREWYFFVPRDHHRKQQQSGGGRPSRTTERGFWKATGSDRAVRCAGDPKRLIGLKKTLVYYEGTAPRGRSLEAPRPTGRTLCFARSTVRLCRSRSLRAACAIGGAGTTATPSNSHNSTGSADSISSSEPQQQQVTMEMKKEEEEASAVLRPSTLSLPQLEVSKPSSQEWILQDPFLTQLRSPWMENWSPYYASVLNF